VLVSADGTDQQQVWGRDEERAARREKQSTDESSVHRLSYKDRPEDCG